ncbi:hypothetical protein M569_07623, partial [Genlisea aurea]
MKFQTGEPPVGKTQARRKTSKLAPLIAITALFTIPLYYYPAIRDSSRKLTSPLYDREDSLVPEEKTNEPPCFLISGQCSDDGSTAEVIHVDADGRTRANHRPDGDASPPRDGHRNRKRPGRGKRKVPRHKQQNPPPSSIYREEARRSRDRGRIRQELLDRDQCDLFSGEWVPNPEGPYYTNETCNAIQEHQNCLKFGRPDEGFLKWQWKPDECELPIFDAHRFLHLVTGKSIAFVGDSVARNHMQSLICLLSQVAEPVDLSHPLDQNKRYEFREFDFNVSMFWAPYLVRTEKTDPNDEKRPFKLYLDEFDENWRIGIAPFDYLIISAGHWFFRPTYFYFNGSLDGCLYCPESDVKHRTSYYSYRRAFRTAFQAIRKSDFSGITFLRTYAPSHFEGAAWDKGGDCVRKRPFRRSDAALEDYSLEMYLIQLEELRIARRKTGGKAFKLFDATRAMVLRPDGHPSKYGHWPVANQSFANDCVHWCLPGPIDSWNDFLQELLSRE